jgi:hypothetical protein
VVLVVRCCRSCWGLLWLRSLEAAFFVLISIVSKHLCKVLDKKSYSWLKNCVTLNVYQISSWYLFKNGMTKKKTIYSLF